MDICSKNTMKYILLQMFLYGQNRTENDVLKWYKLLIQGLDVESTPKVFQAVYDTKRLR